MTFYQIMCDNEIIYDPRSKNKIVLSPVLDLEVGKNGSLSFTIPSSNPCYNLILLRKSIIKVYQVTEKNGELYKERLFRGIAYSDNKDFLKRKQVQCEGELAFFNDSIVRKYQYSGNVRNYLNMLVESHNNQVDNFKKFVLRNCTVEDNNDYITRANENYPTTKSEIDEKLLNSIGGHFETEEINDVVYLDYLSEYNKYNSQSIVFGKNLLDLTECITAENVATRLIGLGKKDEETGEYVTFSNINDGKDYVQDESAIALFGIITDTIEFEDVTIDSNLLSKTQKALENRIITSTTINLSAADLHAIDVDIEALRIGKMTRVISEPHNLDKHFLLSKMSLKLDDLKSSTITLGATFKSLTQRQVVKEKETQFIKSNILQQAKETATNIMNRFNSGYVIKKDGELYIADNIDLDRANHVWKWNINGFAYSENGKNGPYKTAITIDGSIVADFITAGILRGIEIICEKGNIGGFELSKTRFKGNLNGIYDFSLYDVAAAVNHINGSVTLDSATLQLYDLNNDGIVNIVDVVLMLNIIEGRTTNTRNVKGNIEINSNDPKNALVIKDKNGNIVTALGVCGIDSKKILGDIALFGKKSNSNNNYDGVTINGLNSRIYVRDGSGNNTEITSTSVNSQNFNNTSLVELKKNITEIEDEQILENIKKSDIYSFNYKTENDEDKKHFGFIIGNDYKTPGEILNKNKDAVDIYSMASILWRHNQILEKRLSKLESDMEVKK